REFDIKEWYNTLVISAFYFPHSVFQALILLSDGFLSTSEAQWLISRPIFPIIIQPENHKRV
ncbi:hypothetical protein, partial [Porphyromonas gingivalis]|uniref:hypothetical protein n=1 Tax=Porphyromonas gingivalis TaxID=837 RepID=UPI001EE6CDA0